MESGRRAFPPRLAHQPIFYPLLTLSYAQQIARDWNTPDAASDYAGFVTAFDLPRPYADQFEVKTVGGRIHQELWIPAEQLNEFNQQIVRPIRFCAAYYGPQYRGAHPSLSALEHLTFLGQLTDQTTLQADLQTHWQATWLNYPYWRVHHPDQAPLLARIAASWSAMLPHLSLELALPDDEAPSESLFTIGRAT
jgi:hypothetical protein